jgi:hypothetical protein
MLTPSRQFLLALCFLQPVPAPAAIDAAPLQRVFEESLPEQAADALARIPDPGRKLLAARAYYRSQADLGKRWSWSETQIAAFEGSPGHKSLLADIARVNDHFSITNPGFGLYTNTQVRSLDKQIASWNVNVSVGVAAANLLSALESDAGMALEAGNPSLSLQLKAWLRKYKPEPSPNLAAPGLSAHGQMHAIDFQVSKAGTLIAQANSADIESIWRAQGWDVKLKASVASAGPAFEGPLSSPDEPWHYTYTPTHESTGYADISP